MESPKIGLISSIVISMCSISMAQNTPKDFLEAHNAARAEVGVEPLEWDDTVAANAEQYAKSKVKDCVNVGHSGGPYGENIVAINRDLTGTEAVKYWVAEKVNYDHNTNKCINNAECKHYTQLVWSNTFLVGCARAKCDNGGTIVVCTYDPSGNFDGEKPYN